MLLSSLQPMARRKVGCSDRTTRAHERVGRSDVGIRSMTKRTRRNHSVFLVSSLLLMLFADEGSAVITSAIPSQWFPPDARSQGLGRAYTAIAEGPAAVWWNPGGLALIDGLYGTPYSRFPVQPRSDGYDIHSYELSGGRDGLGFGAHLQRMKYENWIFTDESGSAIGRFQPYEYVGILGGGIDLNQRVLHASPALALGIGAGLKIFHTKLAPANLALNHRDWKGTSWDLDLGGLAAYKIPLDAPKPRGRGRDAFLEFRGGFTMHNALATNISYLDGEQDDSLGRELRTGAAVRAGIIDLPPLSYLLEATVSAERNWELDPVSGKPGDFYGVEMTLLGLVSLRHGWIRDDEGQTHDTITGYGAGCDVAMDEHRRLGFRYDFASVPSPNRFWETDARTISFWMSW